MSDQRNLPQHPDFLWRNPEPKKIYDVVIVRGVSEKMHQFAEVIPDQDAVVIADPA